MRSAPARGAGAYLPAISDLMRLFLALSGSNPDRSSLGIHLNMDG